MPDKWPIAEKILMLKGGMTYRELSDAIFQKTGKRIGFTALARLGSGKRAGTRKQTINILAEYAGVHPTWFYEELPSETLNPMPLLHPKTTSSFTGDAVNESKVILSAMESGLRKTGINLELKDLELLFNIVKVFIEKNKEQIEER